MRLRTVMLTAAMVPGLAIIAYLVPTPKAAAQGVRPGSAPVTVQNTSANPVPVTGSVEITNQPALATPTPFQATVSCSLDFTAFARTCDLYTVPQGKRAVIEYFSAARPTGVTGTEMRASLDTTLSGSTARFFIQPLLIGGSIDTGTGQVVRLYADPGTTVVARVATNAAPAFTVTFSISGTLVDVP